MGRTFAGISMPPRLLEGRRPWLPGLVIAMGLTASLAISATLYRSAERQWSARVESEARRLSTTVLGWVDDSYAPLSGLAALVEGAHRAEPAAFLNAFEGMESRGAAVLLGAVAVLEQDAWGPWVLAFSSGNFELLETDAAESFVLLRPVIEWALTRRNQFVLGPPLSTANEPPASPVMIALSNVTVPTILVGKLEYATLQRALLGMPVPRGFYLTLRGKFMDGPEIRPIVQSQADQPPVEELVTRAATAGADLDIVWGVTKRFASGPDYGLATMTLLGGVGATLRLAVLRAMIIGRNGADNSRGA